MKKLVLLAGAALVLSACGSGSAPVITPAPYSAVGSWRMSVKPDSVNDWRDLGTAKFVTQNESGGLDGTFLTQDGTTLGKVAGNVKSGSVGIIIGYNVVNITGSFTGNTYVGRYETFFPGEAKVTGDVKMSR